MSVHMLPLREDRRYHVYTLLCQDGDGPGYVKFGRSSRIGDRLNQLRSTCPIPAHYFGIVDCGYYKRSVDLEAALHRHFASRRVHGEWYRFDFTSSEDKRAFNDGCKVVFRAELGDLEDRWWTKISVKALDEYNRQRRQDFLRSKHRKKLEARRGHLEKVRRAWRELDAYGQSG